MRGGNEGKVPGKVPMKWSTVSCPGCGNQIRRLFSAGQRRASAFECPGCGTVFWATPRGEVMSDMFGHREEDVWEDPA